MHRQTSKKRSRISGFQEWLYNGLDKQTGIAYVQVTVGLPDTPGGTQHQLRLGPAVNSRASMEEAISSAERDVEHREFFFLGSYRGAATLYPGPGKRRSERQLTAQNTILSDQS